LHTGFAKDLALLQTLVEQYQYRLVRYLVYFLGRRDLVDDLVQGRGCG
jgi:DNA-directed RNA polymerase specialized sigma24 family protein